MRTHGTLTRWNDDRGFGFITPANGKAEIFVHITAFPRDGVRPELNELISFETEAGDDGRLRAVRVMRPVQRRSQSPAGRTPSRGARQDHGRRKRAAWPALLAVTLIGAYGYSRFNERMVSAGEATSGVPLELDPSPGYACDGRTLCSEMTSCDEATYFIRNCPNTQMDGDGDGEPCESQWCQ